jgi:general secretion pathway protein K
MIRSKQVFGGARPRRGSVIVVVLVTLLLASLMLMKFMENSAVELVLATRQADKERLRTDAYAALETALAVMAEIKAVDSKLYAPAQGWGDPYGYAGESPREGVTAEFAFTDESGKISLPRLSFEEMIELVQALGLGENDARRFADGLYTWMRPDHTPQEMEAEASRYERERIPHEPPRRSLRSWEELRAVRVARDYVYDEDGGLTPFGAALRENLSLYDYDGSNVNALAPALGTARGWDPMQTSSLASYKAGKAGRKAGAPPWFRDVGDVTSVLGANADVEGLGAEAKLVRVEVTVREGAASMRISALVGVDKSVSLPAIAEGAGATPTPPKEPNAGEPPAEPPGQTPNPPGRRGKRAETSGGGAASEEKLDYPFSILEVVETAGPAPVAPADEAEEDPLS